MTQGSVSYRTVEVGGLPSARTADGAMNARVSIQVRTKEPQVQIARDQYHPHNPNVSSALPRLKLTEESTRRGYLSSSQTGLSPVRDGSARRRKDFIEMPPYQVLQQQSMTLVDMTKAAPSQTRAARLAGLSNPFKPVDRKKTSDLASFPHVKNSLADVSARQTKRLEEAGRHAVGSPPPDVTGVTGDGSPRSVIPGTLQGARWSKRTSVVAPSSVEDDR